LLLLLLLSRLLRLCDQRAGQPEAEEQPRAFVLSSLSHKTFLY
jgi:hypothetical protein